MSRRRYRLLAGLALFVGGLLAAAPVAQGAPCLRPPVDAPVVDPFRAPACPYCAGNRGIEYAPSPGSAVVAAAAGTISFAGVVAGIRYVVVDHDGRWRTTYGKLATIAVRVGVRVAAGDVVGTTTEALYFGLRDGDAYVDPAPSLASLVVQPQLVPLDGVHRRPPRPARLVCPQSVSPPVIR